MTELSDYRRIVEQPMIDGYDAKIKNLKAEITCLRAALSQAWDSRGPDYVETSHPGWCNRVRDLLADADEQTAGEK